MSCCTFIVSKLYLRVRITASSDGTSRKVFGFDNSNIQIVHLFDEVVSAGNFVSTHPPPTTSYAPIWPSFSKSGIRVLQFEVLLVIGNGLLVVLVHGSCWFLRSFFLCWWYSLRFFVFMISFSTTATEALEVSATKSDNVSKWLLISRRKKKEKIASIKKPETQF